MFAAPRVLITANMVLGVLMEQPASYYGILIAFAFLFFSFMNIVIIQQQDARTRSLSAGDSSASSPLTLKYMYICTAET